MKEQLNKDFTKLNKIKTKLLLTSVSKDETRRHLMGVFHDKSRQALISTDGYILTALKSRYCSDLDGKIICPKTMEIINREAARISAIIPYKFKYNEVFSIKKTHYFKAARNSKPEKAHFYFDGSISINDIAPDKELAFTVNAEFLKHLVDNDWSIRWNNELSPIQISLSRYNDFEGDFYIIMPLKN